MRVAIIGAGVMGKDVAITCAAHGHDVILVDNDPQVRDGLGAVIRQLVRQFKLTTPGASEWDSEAIKNAIEVRADLSAVAGAEWIVENISERIEAKQDLHGGLADVVGTAHVAINTSCISITQLAQQLPAPDRVLGMHFMNPVPLINGIEVIRGHRTSEETVQESRRFAESLGKEAIVVDDAPGFVSNRLSHLFMNEAAFLVQDGVAGPAEIDAVFTKGYGHSMGPLATADLIGLDTVVDSLDVLYREFQDSKFRCCPLLRRMVRAGDLGRKSGRGFFTY